jgi:putative ABC transport system permease protein
MRLVTMCFRNLSRRRLRTLLCVFGVAVSTCFIVAVGATTSRCVTIITEMNIFFRGEVIVVAQGVFVIQGFPIGGVIPQNIVDDLNKMDCVERTIPVLFNFEFRPGEASSILPVNATIGLPVEEWSMIVGLSTLKPGGRLPQANSTKEVIIGCSIAEQYGISTDSKINLKGQELTVCGIIEGPSALLARSIIMSLEIAQDIFNYPMQINMAVVKPKPNVTQESLASKIEGEMSHVMVLTENERNELVKPVLEAVENWNMAIQGVLFFLSVILVAIVGMMSVSERRRDFATLDAIGAPLSYVFRLVILETALIGVLGGILGIAFGSLAALVLSSIYTNIPLAQFFPSIFEIVPPAYMLEIFLTVVAVCCVGGIIPAINATRMRIAEVLRAEY